MIQSLDDAWKWYTAVRKIAYDMGASGRDLGRTGPGDSPEPRRPPSTPYRG